VQTRHKLTCCLAIGLTLFAFESTQAQQPRNTRGQASRANNLVEQTARTRWQPTRPQADSRTQFGADGDEAGVRQASHRVSASGTPVRRTQATAELPAPAEPKPLPQPGSSTQRPLAEVPLMDLGNQGYEVPMHSGRSVMEHSPQPLDGEVIYESSPYMDESIGASCDSMGCDSMSCGTSDSCDCSSCRRGAWRPCLTLCFPQNGWVSLEYLMWTQSGMDLPPLVTRSNTGTSRANAGVLGLNSTDILFGGDEVLDDNFSGGRLRFGFWLDKCQTWGIGAEYFELGRESESFSQRSTGNPILARPFFNTLTGREDAELVSFPSVVTGEVSARATSQLVGAGVHLVHQFHCSSGCAPTLFCGKAMVQSRTDFLFGYRYLQLDESVQVTEDLISTDTTDPGAFLINDRFETRNQFNGFDMGIMHNRRRGLWSLDLLAKLAIGNTRQTVDIDGSTRIDGGAPLVGGLLAQTSNIGTYNRDRFTILPELGVTAGYHLTPNFKLTAGYSMIFWSNVVRPGDHIDLDINPNFLPPPAVPFTGANRPGFRFDDSNYYVHGLNLGAAMTW
jgi:hypothetical protein